jgi:hypothetical protein
MWSLLIVLLMGMYAVWLLAGIVDYFCHRRTNIAGTSGRTESWLHLAQFAALGAALLLATLLMMTPIVLVLIVTAVLGHSVLSYIDVSYTQPRRHISPLEQHAHGFLDVRPLIAVALVAALNWHQIRVGFWTLQSRNPALPTLLLVLLLGSYFLLAGAPILEELLRTLKWREASTSTAGAAAGRNRPETATSRTPGSKPAVRW